MTNPEKVFKQGCCQAALFVNEIESKEGRKLRIGKITLQKTYMDKDGKWQNTQSFGVNDLPKLTLAIMEAYDYQTRGRQREEQPSPPAVP